jgi:hypothetical protein
MDQKPGQRAKAAGKKLISSPATRSNTGVSDRETFPLIVGDRAHRIAGIVASLDLPADRVQRALRLTQVGREVFTAHPVIYRPREALMQSVTAAGVYINRFKPETPWVLIGREYEVNGSRFDLVYESDSGVLIDEIKLGIGRTSEVRVRSQIDRYVQLGIKEWGHRFIGVRVCSVHEPARSRLLTPSTKHSSLVSMTELAESLKVR